MNNRHDEVVKHYAEMFNKPKIQTIAADLPAIKKIATVDPEEELTTGGYIHGYDNEDKTKEGIDIAGRDVIRLNAPEVLLSPDTPLLTEAQDIAGAINELFEQGGGEGIFRSLSDSGTTITITNDDKESAVYYYETVTIEKKITINKTEGSGEETTVTTTTQSFTKKIITKIYANVAETDDEGNSIMVQKVIMETKYNEDSGKISGYVDGDNKTVTFKSAT